MNLFAQWLLALALFGLLWPGSLILGAHFISNMNNDLCNKETHYGFLYLWVFSTLLLSCVIFVH